MNLFAVWPMQGLEVEVRAENAHNAVIESGVKNPVIVGCVDPECGCGTRWVVKNTKGGFELALFMWWIDQPH